jgi:hypothetical protein
MDHGKATMREFTNCTFDGADGEPVGMAAEDLDLLSSSWEHLSELERKLADGAEAVESEVEAARRAHHELVARLGAYFSNPLGAASWVNDCTFISTSPAGSDVQASWISIADPSSPVAGEPKIVVSNCTFAPPSM